MGKIKAIDFISLPDKLKKHNLDIFIQETLANLVASTYSRFYSNETLFQKLFDNYLGKCCLDASGNIIKITPALLEQEVRNLAGDQSISCPFQTRTLTARDWKKKPQSRLFLAATLKNLVKHAIRNKGTGSDDDLFATLIYNYLGKWCYDEDGKLIQVSMARLQALTKYFLHDWNIHCQLDVDAVLAARVKDLIKEENACTKTIEFDGTQKTTTENLLFFLEQINDPENIRKKSLSGANKIAYNWKYNYLDKKYYPKVKDENRGQRIKTGTLHTTKTPVSIIPTKPGYMRNFTDSNNNINNNIFLLFALSELHHAHKYLFSDNAGTNDEPQYSASKVIHPWNNGYYVPLKRILKQNRAAVKANEIIDWNEIKAGLPKSGIRAVIASSEQVRDRLYALESMYIIKKTFELDYDLPLAIYQSRENFSDYTHDLRVEDAIASKWYEDKDKKNLFQEIVNSSWNRLQKQRTKDRLQEIFDSHPFILPKTEHFTQGTYKRYNHTLDLSANRMHITQIRPPAPAVLISPPGEKILCVAGMLSFFPIAAYGTYKWIKDSFDEDMETDWEDLGQIVGIVLATVTLLPVFFYGCYYALQNLMAPSRRQGLLPKMQGERCHPEDQRRHTEQRAIS